MFPFHRHHGNSSTSNSTTHKSKAGGNGRSRDRGYSREDDEEFESQVLNSSRYQTRSQSHSQLQQQRWDYVLDQTTNVLRAKENVLLSSLATGVSHECNDNSVRFGSNKHHNVFSSLQNLKEAADVEEDVGEMPSRRVIDSSSLKRFFLEGINQMTSSKNPDRLQQGNNSTKQEEPTNSSTNAAKPSCSLWTAALHTAIVNQVNINTKLLKSSSEDPRDGVIDDILIEELEDVYASTSADDAVVVREDKTAVDIEKDKEKRIEEESNLGEERKSGKNKSTLNDAKAEDRGHLKVADVDESNSVDVQQEEGTPRIAVDDAEEVNVIGTTPVTLSTAVAVKLLLLGSATTTFSLSWLDQGFTFNSNHRLRYGFVQDKDGPCGVLATIQAFLVRTLLFDHVKCTCTEPLRPTGSEARTALITAISDVLWRASANHTPSLALRSDDVVLSDCDAYRRDGLTETLRIATFHSRESLEEAVKQNLDQFTAAGKGGCILLVLSAIFSRGIKRVQSDMDDSSSVLIGSDGQCNMELINLLLTGRAVSNVFDNNINTDTGVMPGIHARSEVGFLTLREHYNACQVGSYLKTPRYPVWVVQRDTHFSVLFSCKRELVSDWRVEKHFTLFHYEALAKQKDEVNLVVDTTGHHTDTHEGLVTSSLDNCIRTKWRGAVVDWKNEPRQQ